MSVKDKGPTLKFKARLEDTRGAWWHLASSCSEISRIFVLLSSENRGQRKEAGRASLPRTGLSQTQSHVLLLKFPHLENETNQMTVFSHFSFFFLIKKFKPQPFIPMTIHLEAQTGSLRVGLSSLWWTNSPLPMLNTLPEPWGAHGSCTSLSTCF